MITADAAPAHEPESEPAYTFPDGPDAAAEWPGTPIGSTNVITRIKGRTSRHDKTLDRDPAGRDALLAWAEGFVRDLGAGVRTHDAVIHGIRVRLYTNSPHQHDFFVRNWFDPMEWEAATGKAAPIEPQLLAYALIDVPGKPEAAYYSRERNVVLFTNSSYYGQLKSWVLGAVGRILAEEQGIHSIHGACVELDGTGILYVAPTGTGKSTSSYGLMTLPGSRFHSDDWVYVRYTVPSRAGVPVSPTSLPGPRGQAAGFRAIELLLRGEAREGSFEGFDLDGDRVRGSTAELDLDAPLHAYAFTSEKRFYLRSNLVESFAPATAALIGSVFENVPDVSPSYLATEAQTLAALEEELGDGRLLSLRGASLRTLLGRMIAFDNARAMLDTAEVFGDERIFANPLEPTRLAVVFLLERDFSADTVLTPLALPPFLGALLDGRTPSGTQETAYNAYRAVDDAAERRFIDSLAADSSDHTAVARAFLDRAESAPPTLQAEMVLFSALHRASRAYALNTILQKDPAVRSRKEAVARTLRVIAEVARGNVSRDLTIATYASALGA